MNHYSLTIVGNPAGFFRVSITGKDAVSKKIESVGFGVEKVELSGDYLQICFLDFLSTLNLQVIQADNIKEENKPPKFKVLLKAETPITIANVVGIIKQSVQEFV